MYPSLRAADQASTMLITNVDFVIRRYALCRVRDKALEDFETQSTGLLVPELSWSTASEEKSITQEMDSHIEFIRTTKVSIFRHIDHKFLINVLHPGSNGKATAKLVILDVVQTAVHTMQAMLSYGLHNP